MYGRSLGIVIFYTFIHDLGKVQIYLFVYEGEMMMLIRLRF